MICNSNDECRCQSPSDIFQFIDRIVEQGEVNGAVKVTSKFTRVVIAATLGIALLYLVAWILSIFDIDMCFWTNPNALGIIVSVGIALVAALTLFIDFDMIDKGVAAGVPKSMEWYSAFGLLATLVWLYLQVLQLLALTRSR